jgi:ferredoxin
MPRPALRQPDLFAEAPSASDNRTERLATFSDANLNSGFLPLAEKAVEACPGDAVIRR